MWDTEYKEDKWTEPIDAWNQNTNLKEAYKNSTIWFYEEIAKRIGKEKYKFVLKECNYGNGDYTEEGIDFWNYGRKSHEKY